MAPAVPGLNRVLCARNSHGNETVVSFFYLFMYHWLLPDRNLLMKWVHLLNWNCCQWRFNKLAEFFYIPILIFLSVSLYFFFLFQIQSWNAAFTQIKEIKIWRKYSKRSESKTVLPSAYLFFCIWLVCGHFPLQIFSSYCGEEKYLNS